MSFKEKHQSAIKRRAKADEERVELVLSNYSKKLKSPTQKLFLSELKTEGVSSATIDQFANSQFFEEALIKPQLDPKSIKIKKAILCGLSGDKKRYRTHYKESYKQNDTRRIVMRVSEIVENDEAFWSLDINEIPKTISLDENNQNFSVETNDWVSFLKGERERYKQKARNAYRRVFGKDATVTSEPFSLIKWRAEDKLARKDEIRAAKLFGSFTKYLHSCGIPTVTNQDKVTNRDLADFVLLVWEFLNVDSKTLSARDLSEYRRKKPDGIYFSVRKFSPFGSTPDQGLRNFSQILANNLDKCDDEILATLQRLAKNTKRAGLYLVKTNGTLWKFGCSAGGVTVEKRIKHHATVHDSKQRDALCKMFAINVEEEESRILARLREMVPVSQHHKKEYFHLDGGQAKKVKELLLKEEGFKVFDQW